MTSMSSVDDAKGFMERSIRERPSRPRLDEGRLVRYFEAQDDVHGEVELMSVEYVEKGGGVNGIALVVAEIDRGEGRTRHDLVVRYKRGEHGLKQKSFADEFRTLQALAVRGIAAPKPFWLDADGALLGFPNFVMERLHAESPAPNMFSRGILANASPEARKEMILDAAGFHGRLRRAAISPEAVPHLLDRGAGSTPIERELSWFFDEAEGSAAEGSPRLEYVADLFRWMVEHQPLTRVATLVHGDAQLANMMFRGGKLLAAIDWELSYLGHNEADIALIALHTETSKTLDTNVEGVPTESELIARYESECGGLVENWEYFSVVNPFKVLCLLASGADEAVWSFYADQTETLWRRARHSWKV